MVDGIEEELLKSGSDDDIVRLVQQRWQDARTHWMEWRTEAREAYGLVAGVQFDRHELAILEKQKRPPTVFNRIGPVIDAVCGSEAQNRQAIKYAPRELQDSGLSQFLSNAAAWVRDRSNADIEENEAFRDALTCGVGCTITRVSYSSNPDGEIEIMRIDPLEVYPDPGSSRRNFVDARWIIAERWVAGADVKDEWPKAWGELGPTNLDTADSSGAEAGDEDYGAETNQHYRAASDEYRLIECEWREAKKYFRVLDPATKTVIDIDAKRWALMEQTFTANGMPPPNAVPAKKWEWRRAIVCGETLLDDGSAPAKSGSSYKFITGTRDRNQRMYYGLVRAMKDPQKWANKWLSQTLHIFNANAKGGVMFEAGAFDNPKQAKEDWGKSDGWFQLNPGGLQKVQQRQPITYPAGLDNLMQFAVSSIRDVTGVNLEILGMADRQQAGVLEAQRKQAALTILAAWFDALRAYRREHGKLMYEFIQKYISDGRLIRIDGDNGPRNIPLLRAPEGLEFDVIVDSAPASVNVKQQTFETLQAIVPAMAKLGMPIPPSVLKYLPIPESLAVEWQKLLQEKSGAPSPEIQQVMEDGKNQIQQLSQALQERDQALQKMQGEVQMMTIALESAKAANNGQMQSAVISKLEADIKAQSVQIDAYNAETKRIQVEQEAQAAAMERNMALIKDQREQQALADAPLIEQQRQAQIQDIVAAALQPMAQQIVAAVTEAVNAPKRLEYGDDGLVASMNGRPIVRAPDGRIVGIQ
jgi:hypothetical protein